MGAWVRGCVRGLLSIKATMKRRAAMFAQRMSPTKAVTRLPSQNEDANLMNSTSMLCLHPSRQLQKLKAEIQFVRDRRRVFEKEARRPPLPVLFAVTWTDTLPTGLAVATKR